MFPVVKRQHGTEGETRDARRVETATGRSRRWHLEVQTARDRNRGRRRSGDGERDRESVMKEVDATDRGSGRGKLRRWRMANLSIKEACRRRATEGRWRWKMG